MAQKQADPETSDWGHKINAIIGSLALAGIIGGITTWNKGEMTAARVIALEERLQEAGKDRFTGSDGDDLDARIREIETDMARIEVRLDYVEK